MQCEDNAKLRTPLNAVCQTPDIGCVPIVNGKPTCNPQPDEIPIAFDPSTTTLWLFGCKNREWVPFQKFSMCQLSSINLENIQNICDVLQIGVSYNPGTGCRQGSMSLAEFAEQLLKCIQLKTKAVSVTANGDKLKIWVDGLDPLPPFYVKGRNLWSEGGSGTDSDPLKIATHDPICQWPIKTKEQIDNAATKHIGACVDGNMVRAPYPEMPCEFPQMTIEQVNAAADKDMIVCVNGENAKVPIHDQLLTPICDNPQISVPQAKAKPKLRIVSCEDGRILLFPLPPEMFQGYYMCVPFIDGVPSGPPAEGSGPIRFDCNDDIWFWVCEENRWHRIDVGNHYHPPWKEVYDFIANRCENIKFHGWSEQDECYTDFEMTPQELADFILCECLDPVTPVQANAAIDRDEEVKFPICVDGTAKKIDWSLCSWPYISPAQINAAIAREEEANLGICVDGKNYKTPWNVCAYPDVPQSEMENLDDIYLAICAENNGNFENRKISITRVVNNYFGVDFYSAGSHGSDWKHFKGTVTPVGEKAVYKSTSKSPLLGTGELQYIPYGKPYVTITNKSKLMKFYTVFHVVRLIRNENQIDKCNFGVMSALTASPSFCEVGTYAGAYYATESERGNTSEVPWLNGDSGCGDEPTLNTDSDSFNIYNTKMGAIRTKCFASLVKNGPLTQWNENGFHQHNVSMQFAFLYLEPGQTVKISIESMIVLSAMEGTQSIEVFGNTRFYVVGYPTSLLNSDLGDDD